MRLLAALLAFCLAVWVVGLWMLNSLGIPPEAVLGTLLAASVLFGLVWERVDRV